MSKSACRQFHFACLRLCILTACILSSLPAIAQEPAPSLSEEVDVSLVSIYAVVTDSSGKPVQGLSKADFQLTDEGRPVDISQFSGDPSEPASIAFLLDTSGSMRRGDKFDAAIHVIVYLMDLLQKDDEVSLITFSDGEVKTIVGFTADKPRVSAELPGLKLFGATAIWDAVVFSQKLVIENYGKKAIVLISDGLDTRSENVFRRAVEEAAKIQLPVYVVEINIPEEAEEREWNFDSPLQNFAEATGALYFSISGDEEKPVRKIAQSLQKEIRLQYYLGISGSVAITPHLKVSLRKGNYRVRLRHSLTGSPGESHSQ